MTSTQIYLDYNATAPPLPSVLRKLQEVSASCFGNPSSPHRAGRQAKTLLEDARQSIADQLGIARQELFFTSGGSESNNAILRQFVLSDKPNHWILSPLEHPSLLETAHLLAEAGRVDVSLLPVLPSGQVDVASLPELIRPETSLLSVMSANNETGVVQPIAELQQIAAEHHVRLHTDSVQMLGRMPLSWRDWQVDYATATAHKLGGPRGIGLLYLREGSPFQPLVTGGKQERVRRAGTESVALAVGFAEAITQALAQRETLAQRLSAFQQQILRDLEGLEGFFLKATANGSSPTRSTSVFGGSAPRRC
jgi:cysteine desulfurase